MTVTGKVAGIMSQILKEKRARLRSGLRNNENIMVSALSPERCEEKDSQEVPQNPSQSQYPGQRKQEELFKHVRLERMGIT